MLRRTFIERCLIQIHGGEPTDDSEINYNLINAWLPDAIALAAKQNYKDNLQLEGVGFLNNSFYTKFKALPIVADEQFQWKVTLPEIPVGIGSSEGIATIVFKNSTNAISYPGIPLSENQVGYVRGMREIPNKVMFYAEGIYCYVMTPINMSQYTATVTMVSGGDGSDLDSIINLPPDYFPIVVGYIQQQLLLEQKQPKDLANDGTAD